MENEEFLTIAEFATRAGVTTQAVYKRLDGDLKEFVKEIGKKKRLSTAALVFFEKSTSNNEKSTVDNNSTELTTLIELLKSDLKTKDDQIAQLGQALDQAQKLHAMDKQNLLTDSERVETAEANAQAQADLATAAQKDAEDLRRQLAAMKAEKEAAEKLAAEAQAKADQSEAEKGEAEKRIAEAEKAKTEAEQNAEKMKNAGFWQRLKGWK